MNRVYQLCAALIPLLAMSGFVQAAESGFYIGAGLGQAQQDVRPSDGMLIAIGSPFGGGVVMVRPDAIDVDDDELSWSGVLGYRINAYLSAELAYLNFGETDVSEHYTLPEPPLPFFPTELTRDFSASVAGPALSMLGSLPLGAGFAIFVRGGVLFADQEIKLLPAANPESMTFGDEVWLAGIGADWTFANRWALRLEYLRTGKLDDNIVSGKSDIDLLNLGILFRL